MSVEKAIVAELNNDPEFAGLVGGRLAPLDGHGASIPFVNYEVDSGEPTDEYSTLERMSLSLNIYAESYASGRTIVDAIKRVLHGKKFATQTTSVRGCFFKGIDDSFEGPLVGDDVPEFVARMIFEVFAKPI